MWVLIAGGQNTPGSEDREERGVGYERSRGLKTEGLGLKGMGGMDPWLLLGLGLGECLGSWR